jgi:hypothetical protein
MQKKAVYKKVMIKIAGRLEKFCKKKWEEILFD